MVGHDSTLKEEHVQDKTLDFPLEVGTCCLGCNEKGSLLTKGRVNIIWVI